jgi:hypothetical protein
MKPSVVITVDTFGWAFYNIAKQIERHFSDRFDITIIDRVDSDHPVECDVFMAFWWKSALSQRSWIKAKRVCVGMYDHWSVPLLPHKFQEVAGFADCFFAGNETIQADLRLRAPDTPVYLTEDGVDLDVFTPQPYPETFTIGWTGNRIYENIGLGDLKGVNMIEEAARRCNVPLVIQDKQVNQLKQVDMPDQFYRRISCYVCASLCEGTPVPSLESLATGRILVSTKVGVVPKLAADNPDSVIMVNRTVDAIVEGIQKARSLSESVHKAPRQISKWDWKEKVKAFIPVLEGE